jgi:long-subunit acyl-CoA synthetase (AMP-forming)
MLSSGAAPLTRELVEATYDRIKVGVRQGYGLSETSPAAHIQQWHEWRTSIGSVGRLLPNLESKYMTLSENGSTPSEVAEGEVGELYLRGPNIFLGYHNNPTATAECLSPDGWFRTGDVGFQDRVGNFYVTDRAKELIKYNGFQVAPAELEGILIGQDWVEDAGVVGFQSKDMHTELPLAFVVATAACKACKACKQSEDEKPDRLLDGWMRESHTTNAFALVSISLLPYRRIRVARSCADC